MSSPVSESTLAGLTGTVLTPSSVDHVGSWGTEPGDQLIEQTIDVVARVVRPQAEATDRSGLARPVLAAMGRAGLMGMAAPAEFGGSAASAAQWREVGELVMAADGTAWFCWSQHHMLVRALAALPPSALRASILPRLVTGDLIGAVAFSHVRRSGARPLAAVKTPGGWQVTGRLDWVSGWDVADVVHVLAETDDGKVVQFMLHTSPQPGVTIHEPLALMAMQGSHTRPVSFEQFYVPDEYCLGVLDRGMWLAIDERIGAMPTPPAFGLVRASISSLIELADHSPGTDTTDITDTAMALSAEVVSLRDVAYRAIDDRAPIPTLMALRGRSLELASRSCASTVMAAGSRALAPGSDVGRRYREAAFLSVFRQSPAARSAALAQMGPGLSASS